AFPADELVQIDVHRQPGPAEVFLSPVIATRDVAIGIIRFKEIERHPVILELRTQPSPIAGEIVRLLETLVCRQILSTGSSRCGVTREGRSEAGEEQGGECYQPDKQFAAVVE